MMSIDSPLFRGSQWMHCKNSTATAIPPYGIAQVVGMDTAVIGDISQPVMLVRAAQVDNPEVTVFTGPIGVPASGIGLCHSGDFGYARTSQASFSIGTNQGVTSGSTSLARGSGDFFEIGDTFTISGTTIGLFHKKSRGGASLYRFTLNADWSSGVADADILNMDGTDTGIDDDVRDPLGIFGDLGNGDAGLCMLQGGNYYVIQAPCPA